MRPGLRRLVWPEATSVTQTLLSMMYAIRGPSGLQVKAEATDHGFLVTCPSEPPLGEIVQSYTTLALSSLRNAIWEPSSELRNQWRGPWMTGNRRSALNVSRR